MNSELLDGVKKLYTSFDVQLLTSLDQLYSEQVIFIDPFHQLAGLKELRNYYANLLNGLDECRFEFHQQLESPALDGKAGEAVLFWVMHYRHRRLAGGRPLTLHGNSHLRFEDRIVYHRDYFDAGAMLYEHVPLLGSVIRHIKNRLES